MSTNALPPGIALRPIGEGDTPFLRDLYGSTRQQELDRTGWDSEQRSAFVAMQFAAQHKHYRERYPNADFDLIERDGVPIGRLYLDARVDGLRLLDITLLPDQRNRGLGSTLIRHLLRRAEHDGLALHIHVERGNPAARLYRRLGFHTLETRDPYLFMEWRAPHPDVATG
jgi:ribosomal protein S18 acetylase RimI-like enzyme